MYAKIVSFVQKKTYSCLIYSSKYTVENDDKHKTNVYG